MSNNSDYIALNFRKLAKYGIPLSRYTSGGIYSSITSLILLIEYHMFLNARLLILPAFILNHHGIHEVI